MAVDRAWIRRNLGFDAVEDVIKSDAHTERSRDRADIWREVIDFDSEAPTGQSFLARGPANGLAQFTEIAWPSALAPTTGTLAPRKKSARLPRADVLVVTWTVDEGHALSRVLTPGKDSRDDYLHYTRGWRTFSKRLRADCPAAVSKRLGAYWTTRVGSKSVVVFKSESHLSQDGPAVPNIDLWRQIIQEVQPELVITTGTAGGIGSAFQVGDVVVSPVVRFNCQAQHKSQPFALASYASAPASASKFGLARAMIKFNAGQLPKDNKRPPKIVRVAATAVNSAVMTTDFFGFDTSDNRFKLQGLGTAAEMGDAVLGLVASELGTDAPRWLAIRNISNPQIKVDGLTPQQQASLSGQIYKAYGRWSSVCSAIVCWATIAAEQ